MKAVLMSIQAKHNRNIESGDKTSELRTAPPTLKPPFKVYTYESGVDGRRKVVNEWVCRKVTEWRICMGVPAHLPIRACLSVGEIKAYSGKNFKNISEMEISDLKIYDRPKELCEFSKPECEKSGDTCSHCCYSINVGYYEYPEWGCDRTISRPPQNWMYVEGGKE